MLLLVDGGIISAGFVQAVRNRGGHVLASLPSGMWEKGPETQTQGWKPTRATQAE